LKQMEKISIAFMFLAALLTAMPFTLAAPVCGNNIAEVGEACDGTDVGGDTCASIPGFKSGTLSCNADCRSLDFASCQKGNEVRAASCSRGDVLEAIDDAGNGDTVLVPEGSCDWNGNIAISKGISIMGGGIGKTIITSTNACPSGWFIDYTPSDFQVNQGFRISGLTLDLGNKCPGIRLNGAASSSVTVQTKVVIDHIRFANVAGDGQAIYVNGMRGVVHDNIFDNVSYPIRLPSSYRNGKEWWDNWEGVVFGKPNNNMYFEDNMFTGLQSGILADCQYANRYAFRYNTINLSANAYSLFDMHGNQGTGHMYSCFGGELYGNQINAGPYTVGLLDQRGGKAVVFNNNVATSGSFFTKIREEYDDSLNPTTNPSPQHVSESYYWNNRKNNATLIHSKIPAEPPGTASGGGSNYLDNSKANFPSGFGTPARYGLEIFAGAGAGQQRLISGTTPNRLIVTPDWNIVPDATSRYRIVADCCNVVHENAEFYNQAQAFDGSVGIGCGLLSSRPAVCAMGVAYWATEQPCNSISPGATGIHPATPAFGTLYKCTAPNIWTDYFIPYPYPHPLSLLDAGKAIAGKSDADHDGVPDPVDRCPKTAIAARNFVNQYGCSLPIAAKFDIRPDFNATDINGMQNLELGISNIGKISYTNQNILLVKTTNGEDDRLDIDAGLGISQNKITLNQSSLPQLNLPATITLYNANFNSPKILKDGAECSQCSIVSYGRAAKEVVFSVPGF